MPSALRVGILGWIAGEVDTFGYLALGHVFVTHMAGNAGVLADAVIERDGARRFISVSRSRPSSRARRAAA